MTDDEGSPVPLPIYEGLRDGILELLDTAREQAARRVNALMTATYWEIGRRIVEIELDGAERAGYGEVLIERLAGDLSGRLGRGFSRSNLFQMRAFYTAWPPDRIVQTVSGQLLGTIDPLSIEQVSEAFPLPWSAYVLLLRIRSADARRFYEMEALSGGWSVRQLRRQIDSQFYERTALSRDKAAMLGRSDATRSADILTPAEAIKDPYVLEFLDLKDEYSESDLEAALIERLADFLLELGDDFAFVGRQRRLRLDDTWFRVDLLFFHRRLRCLVIIDLKVGRFSHADAGQMHMYLNYAREHWMKEGENPPVGVILVASKGEAEAHYALEGLSNTVLAAEYRTVLPDEALLAEQLAEAQRTIAQRDAEGPFDRGENAGGTR